MASQNAFTATAAFCHRHLMESEKALGYLRDDRGLTDSTIAHFRLGLFPRSMGGLFTEVPAVALREQGIIKNASSSLFRTWRLVMPVTDVYGCDIAFAGRILPWEEPRKKKLPKYMNTVYPKTRYLFGLNFARRHIALRNTAHVVEGYFDVIRAHQEGLRTVVGCSGTSFSRRQFALLARYAHRIILLFDNDDAGQASARTHVQRKQHDGIELLALNPFEQAGVKDLDEFLAEHPASDIDEAPWQGRGYRHIRPLW